MAMDTSSSLPNPKGSEGRTSHELVELEGHIVDSLTLAKVLDLLVARGADYEMVDVAIGRTNLDTSKVLMEIRTNDEKSLADLLEELLAYGVNRVAAGDATLVPAEASGVLPRDFYATTNLPTSVSIDGHWREVINPEMDCGLVVRGSDVVESIPMHRVRVGDLIVVGTKGVRVTSALRHQSATSFEFMSSEMSSEKPKALLVAKVAERMRQVKESGGRILFVCGPVVIHTGAGPDLAKLVREGWVDVLFAGNGFATHDLEANVYGTSLGASLHEGGATEGGHANHLRVINEIRRYGSIAEAIDAGYVSGGVMFECVRNGVPFVLGGSVRDDGPLPDVYTDVVAATDAMRACLSGVQLVVMLASTLHAIATGNLLPASVETYCVDISHAAVTKLSDRGSHQALGIVTDAGLFIRDLAEQLSWIDQ